MIPIRSRRDVHLPVAVGGSTVALILAGVFAPAVAWSPDPIMGGPMFAPNQLVLYRWSSSGTPPLAAQTAINAAADATVRTSASRAPLFSYYPPAATSVVYYGVSVPCGVNGLACMQRNAPTGFGLWFREDGHRYDWGTLRWCEMSGSPDGCFEIQNITINELGHVADLDHHVNLPDQSDYTDAVVQSGQRTKPRPGWNAHAFGRCDVATLQLLYDVLTPATLYSTCSDIPTALSLSAASTSVVAGTTVRFTASLASRGTGLLGDNPVASRVVILQARSGTSWVDVLTLSPGTVLGTYGSSLTLWGTGDYRAIFRKPGNEGLRESVSAPVTVTVTPACRPSACVYAPSAVP
jgi:hypothetical protein